MTMTAPTELLTRRQWSTTILVVALAIGALVGFLVGHRSTLHTESVECLSAEGVISCTLDDGWDISIPLDVAWTDATGSYHGSGRPACLPPTGRGLEDPVQVAWTKVTADGVGWRQVVWVGC